MKNELKTTSHDHWETEYNRVGIPSSRRTEPSNVVRDFIKYIDLAGGDFRAALDIGCGSGRNSVFLAELGLSVIAVDYAPSQIKNLRQKAEELKLDHRITSIVHDVGAPWPITDMTVDIAIDTYCFKHQIHHRAVETYTREIRRVLRPGGWLLLFLADKMDGYYSKFPMADQSGIGTIIRDPGNKILSRLYDRDEIEQLFDGFEVVAYQSKPSRNDMHGTIYNRLSHVWYMRRT